MICFLHSAMDRSPVDNVSFKIISLNARGIRDFTKRKAGFNWLHKQNADVAFLQETYSTPDKQVGDFSGPGKCTFLTVPITVEVF